MERLNIVTWHWGSKYPGHYIERLKAGVTRHLAQEFRFCVFAPEQEDEYLTKIPGCFCRLRMFSPEWQAKHNLTGRIVCIDLDAVITGPLDPLFDRPEPFNILHGGNSANPCPYNGSMMMLRAGAHAEIWNEFTLKNAFAVPSFAYPDDQGWLAAKLPNASGWRVGSESGAYCFKKPGWPDGDDLPKDARIVAFPGWRDPAKFQHLAWVKANWA
jgi:hypothetical protein